MIAVEAEREQWTALLARLPKCSGCSAPATIRLREPGASYVTCARCAAERPAARVEALHHGELVTSIEAALRRSDILDPELRV